jgi:hypothetical protein
MIDQLKAIQALVRPLVGHDDKERDALNEIEMKLLALIEQVEKQEPKPITEGGAA